MENIQGKPQDFVSIIIPCRIIDEQTKRCVSYCEKLRNNKEIIVVPDSVCPGYPAIKRNYAMASAKGNVYAFIDSDAYPSICWLDNALHYLQTYSAVCGPGVLPFDANVYEMVADVILQMMPYAYRVVPKAPNFVAEFPTFNLIVRKEVATPFENYLTGEDSLFCRKIKEGIYYHPSILVYHNRRPLFRALWKQIGTYGRHRGNFIKIAIFGLISVTFIYAMNFIRGLFMKRPS